MEQTTAVVEWVEARHPETGNLATFTRQALDEVYRARGWVGVGDEAETPELVPPAPEVPPRGPRVQTEKE